MLHGKSMNERTHLIIEGHDFRTVLSGDWKYPLFDRICKDVLLRISEQELVNHVDSDRSEYLRMKELLSEKPRVD